jgi:hypothetical protein
MAATFPLPLATSGFSFVIATKSRVNELTVSCGTLTLEPEPPPEPDEPPLLPQAATNARPADMASAAVTFLLLVKYKEHHLLRWQAAA